MRPRRSAERPRGGLDLTDLVVGFGLLVIIPFIVVLVIKMSVKTEVDQGSFRQKPEIGEPPPTVEEVSARLGYFRRLYHENGRLFVDRARKATGFQQSKERRWARVCLAKIESELAGLTSLIERTKSQEQFGVELEEIAQLRRMIQVDSQSIPELDILGRPAAPAGG
jgi:hypothetical protein